jgi:hypothetical protein
MIDFTGIVVVSIPATTALQRIRVGMLTKNKMELGSPTYIAKKWKCNDASDLQAWVYSFLFIDRVTD